MSGRNQGGGWKGDVLLIIIILVCFAAYAAQLALGIRNAFVGVVATLTPIVGTLLGIIAAAIVIKNYWTNRW